MIFTECKHIFPAMIKARSSVSEIVKDTKGNYGKYATLAGINDAIMPALVANGLTLAQEVSTAYHDTTLLVTVETWLCHTSGEFIQFAPLALPVDKPTAQGVGSAITYGRRYALMAALNLSADDDDGQAASTGATSQRTAPAPKAPQSAPQPPPTGNGKAAPEDDADTDDLYDRNDPLFAEVKRLRTRANTIGSSIWETKWDDVRHTNIGKMTTGRTQSIKMLTIEELRRLVQGLEDKQDSLRKPQPEAA